MGGLQMCLDHPDLVAANLIISSATRLTRFVDSIDLLRDLCTKYKEMMDEFVRRCFSKRTRRERPEIYALLKNNLLDGVAFPRRMCPGRAHRKSLELGYHRQAGLDRPTHADRGGGRG